MMSDFKKRPSYMELCLCHRCVDVYYNDPAYLVERSDAMQTVKDLCDVCCQYRGFDYSIWKKPSNVRFPNSHH